MTLLYFSNKLEIACLIGQSAFHQLLQLIARLKSIFMEHLDCIQGVFIQSLADQGRFLKEVMGDGEDVATDLVVAPIGAIQQFARTGLPVRARRQAQINS